MKIHYIKHDWHGPNFWTGMLLIQKDNSCFLIDTAVKGAVKATLAPFLKKEKIAWDSIAYIINTHSHGDHAECNAEIRELSGAKIAVHKLGADVLRKISPVDLELSDGDIVSHNDLSLKIIHTPGHSADSICVLEPETGTLYTGDSVQGMGSKNVGLALYSDHFAYLDSLKKILALCKKGEVRRMILGHPEQPLSGEIEQRELLEFMKMSINIAEVYLLLTKELLMCNPDADKFLLREHMIHNICCIDRPVWSDHAFGVCDALLRACKMR